MSLSDVLRGVPELSGSDIEILLQAGSQLQNIADLCNNDIFLDCPVTENIALVAAHARPASGFSVYERASPSAISKPKRRKDARCGRTFARCWRTTAGSSAC